MIKMIPQSARNFETTQQKSRSNPKFPYKKGITTTKHSDKNMKDQTLSTKKRKKRKIKPKKETGTRSKKKLT